MRVTCAGSGDAFGSGGRLNTCFYVQAEKTDFLIDCGTSAMMSSAMLDNLDNIDLEAAYDGLVVTI